MSTPSLDEILASPSLPTLPKVAMEVLELTRDPEVHVVQIADVIQYDPGLSGKILKTVNSSYYGLSKPCPSISRAIGLLGIDPLKTLVLGFSLIEVTRSENLASLDLRSFWQRSVIGAAAARRIAQRVGGIDVEEAFTAALLQDIGMLALHSTTSVSYPQIIDAAGSDHVSLPQIEAKQLAFTHADAGAGLARKWQLPELLIEPIKLHHPQDEQRSINDLVNAVRLAFEIAHTVELQSELEDGVTPEWSAARRLERLWTIGSALFGLTPDEINQLVRATTEDARELSGLLSVDMGETVNVHRLLAEAEDARVAHSIGMQRRTNELEERNNELAQEAQTDQLTGAFNRGWFDDTLAERFEQASSMNGTLGLVFVDADHFKAMNDTHGHQAGDAVLIELVRRLESAVGNAGQVCRYGGEEFAIILPGTTIQASGAIAEKARQIVAATPFCLRDTGASADEATVTISLGVAGLDPGANSMYANPAALLAAADKAVYVAKQSGRDCVRAMRPKAAA